VPLPEALARFADDVADPAADLVVAAQGQRRLPGG